MKRLLLPCIIFLCFSICTYGQYANRPLSNLKPTAVNLSLVPGVDSSIDLGSLSHQWKTLHLGQGIYLDGTIFMHNGTRYSNAYLGYEAGLYNTTGGANTGIGFRALANNTKGDFNTATGLEALFSNSTGNSNVATGYGSLHANTTGGANVASGNAALYLNKTGSWNVAEGANAMLYNTTGSNNVASGAEALIKNTTGNSNVAIGSEALANSTAISNLVAIGDYALSSLNGGLGGNTAVGSKAGMKLSTGNYSTYIGWQSGYNSTTGDANTAVGASSLLSNTTGSDNIAMGVDALTYNTRGSYNTIIGKGAGFANTTGKANVSLGVRSLYSNISGSGNTAIGDSAGFTNKGNYNTFLGAFADVTTNGLSNATAIGYSAKVSTNNTIVLGDATTTTNVAIGATTAGVYKLKVVQSSYGFDLSNPTSGNHWEHYVSNSGGTTHGGDPFTAGDMVLYYNGGFLPLGAFDHTSGIYRPCSDERMKTNIKPMTSILDKINLLEPVTYNFKNSTNQNTSPGFIAQQVEKIFPSLVKHYVDTARGTDVNLMDYTGFGVIAIKGIQELQQQMHDKDTTINYQQKQIDELKNMLLALQQKVESCSPCSNSAVQPANQSSVILTNTAMLAQNIPNPFTNTTVINYTLPQKSGNAQIFITDKSGKTIKQINVSGVGKGSVTIDASTLASGAYSYSFFVDGKLIGTKQMILAK